MNKYRQFFTLLLFSFPALSYGLTIPGNWNINTPHINIGTLTEMNYNTVVKNILKFDPLIENDAVWDRTLRRFIFISHDDFIPLKAFKQYDEKNNITLYRLMFKRNPKNMKDDHPFYWEGWETETYQMVYQVDETSAELLFAGYYHSRHYRTSTEGVAEADAYTNMMPLIQDGKIKGIMIYRYAIYRLIILARDTIYTDHEADILWNNWVSNISAHQGFDIGIRAADPLLDEQGGDIFRYTIQNAFDGNPSTSFAAAMRSETIVEKEDSIYLDFLFDDVGSYDRITGLAIINGYAANERLYKANNRISRIVLFVPSRNIENFYSSLEDNTLSYQKFILDMPIFDRKIIFAVKNIYKGSLYNDTCLAELNIRLNDQWIFGNTDEPSE